MRKLNNVSKDKSKTNIQSGTTRYDIIFSDYAKKMNYYNIILNQSL